VRRRAPRGRKKGKEGVETAKASAVIGSFLLRKSPAKQKGAAGKAIKNAQLRLHGRSSGGTSKRGSYASIKGGNDSLVPGPNYGAIWEKN